MYSISEDSRDSGTALQQFKKIKIKNYRVYSKTMKPVVKYNIINTRAMIFQSIRPTDFVIKDKLPAKSDYSFAKIDGYA